MWGSTHAPVVRKYVRTITLPHTDIGIPTRCKGRTTPVNQMLLQPTSVSTMGNEHTGGIRMDNDQEAREVGQAVNARSTHDSVAAGLLEDGSEDDSGPVLTFRRLLQHSTEYPPLSQPTIGGLEEDWALSDDDASDRERQRRLCRKRKLRLDILARTHASIKRRKGNLAGHTSSEPPIQGLGITTDTEGEDDKEGYGTTTGATDSS